MAFPVSPTEGQTYTEDNTVWIYSAVTGQWNRSVVNPGNSTDYRSGKGYVGSDLTVDGDFTLDDGGTYTTTLQTITPTANRTISLPNSTGTVALVAGSSGQFIFNNAGALGGSTVLSIDGSNNITQNAGRYLLGVTSANANGGALQLSGGITFPATQVAASDPNTLDDYEEGTWTPGQGTGVTVVGTFSSTGKYTKIGRIINYEGIIFGSTSVAYNSAGVTSIATGLPFTVASGGVNGTATNNAATAFSFVIAAGPASVLGESSIAATTAIYFSGQYIV